MASYTIEWRSSARRELKRLSPETISRIITAIGKLSNDPRPTGCSKLRGSEYTYRVRVGSYRVIYEILDKPLVVQIVRVRHRREAYR